MPRFIYTPDMLRFLKSGYTKMRVPELTAAFNKKFGTDKAASAIRSALRNHRFTCGRRVGSPKGARISLLTPEQVAFIKLHYKKLPMAALLEALNREFRLSVRQSQLVAFTKKHHIKSGRSGRFEKGNVSWNTGTAGNGVCKPNAGSFQVGHQAKNYKPLGHERVTKDGYIMVKIADRNPWNDFPSGWYRLKHLVEWEKVHGSLPEGHVLRFVDGDRQNCTLDNLTLVNRGVNARLTLMGFNGMQEELKPTVLAIATVDQVVFEKEIKEARAV